MSSKYYKKPHLPLHFIELVFDDDMAMTQDKQDMIREKMWKNIGVVADILKHIEENNVDESRLQPVFDKYSLTSEADGTVDVFKTEMFRTVECISYFNENDDLKREQAEELNQSFEMLKEVAKELGVSIK